MFQRLNATMLQKGTMSEQEREACVKEFQVERKVAMFLEEKSSWTEEIL